MVESFSSPWHRRQSLKGNRSVIYVQWGDHKLVVCWFDLYFQLIIKISNESLSCPSAEVNIDWKRQFHLFILQHIFLFSLSLHLNWDWEWEWEEEEDDDDERHCASSFFFFWWFASIPIIVLSISLAKIVSLRTTSINMQFGQCTRFE